MDQDEIVAIGAVAVPDERIGLIGLRVADTIDLEAKAVDHEETEEIVLSVQRDLNEARMSVVRPHDLTAARVP